MQENPLIKFVLFGRTGAGKTTIINSIANQMNEVHKNKEEEKVKLLCNRQEFDRPPFKAEKSRRRKNKDFFFSEEKQKI